MAGSGKKRGMRQDDGDSASLSRRKNARAWRAFDSRLDGGPALGAIYLSRLLGDGESLHTQIPEVAHISGKSFFWTYYSPLWGPIFSGLQSGV
jgi:hypothetical protein